AGRALERQDRARRSHSRHRGRRRGALRLLRTGLQPRPPLLHDAARAALAYPDPRPRGRDDLSASGDPPDPCLARGRDARGARIRSLQPRNVQRPGDGHGQEPALESRAEERGAGRRMGAVAVRAGEAVINIHATAFIAPGAVVLGDGTLAARASVWYGAVLRGDMAPIVVGEATNLQD